MKQNSSPVPRHRQSAFQAVAQTNQSGREWLTELKTDDRDSKLPKKNSFVKSAPMKVLGENATAELSADGRKPKKKETAAKVKEYLNERYEAKKQERWPKIESGELQPGANALGGSLPQRLFQRFYRAETLKTFLCGLHRHRKVQDQSSFTWLLHQDHALFDGPVRHPEEIQLADLQTC